MTTVLTAANEDAGTRLDAFVASRANGLTRSQAARYIEEGRVSVEGKPASKSCRIGGGETVTVDVPEVRETALEPQDIPLPEAWGCWETEPLLLLAGACLLLGRLGKGKKERPAVGGSFLLEKKLQEGEQSAL